MGTIELAGVTRRFDDVTAVRDVDLTIEDGEFLVLVGPSGSGKTTLLRTIAGLETPTRGDVFIGGERVTDRPARKRDVALVFQDFALFPHMNVRENLGFNLRTRGGVGDIDTRVEETAATLGIEGLLDREVDELSGGQKQRVALGRAVAGEPTAFLLDEPFANLDAPLRDRMRTEIGRLQRRLGVTTVYVTHDQREAMALADRIAVLNEGELQQVGTPEAVYERPANRFVARFFGDPPMNLLDGRYDPEREVVELAGDRTLPVAVDAADPPETMTVGVRPEDVDLSEAGRLTGTVDYLEFYGADAVVYLDVPDLPELVARTGTDHGLAPGDAVGVDVPPERVHAFDPDGDRLSREYYNHSK